MRHSKFRLIAAVLLFVFFITYVGYFILQKENNAYQTNVSYAPYADYGEISFNPSQDKNTRTSNLYFNINNLDILRKTEKITLVFSTEISSNRKGPVPPKIFDGSISIPQSTCVFSIHNSIFNDVLQYKNPGFNTLDFYLNKPCQINNDAKQVILQLKYSLFGNLFLRVIQDAPAETVKNSILSVDPTKLDKNLVLSVSPTAETLVKTNNNILPLGNFIFPDIKNTVLPTWSLISHTWGIHGNTIVLIGFVSLLLVLILFLFITLYSKESPNKFILYGTLLYFFLGVFWASVGGIPYSGNDEVGHTLSYTRATSESSNLDTNISGFTTLFNNVEADRIRGRILEKYLSQNVTSQHPNGSMYGDPEASTRSPLTYSYWKTISHFVTIYNDPGVRLWLIRAFNVLCFAFSFLIGTLILKKSEANTFTIKSFTFIPLFAISLLYNSTDVSNYLFLICFPLILSSFCISILSTDKKNSFESPALCILFGICTSLLLISSTSSFPIIPCMLILFSVHIYFSNTRILFSIRQTAFMAIGFYAYTFFDNKNYFSSLQGRLQSAVNDNYFWFAFISSKYTTYFMPILIFIFCLFILFILHYSSAILKKIKKHLFKPSVYIPIISFISICFIFFVYRLIHFVFSHMHDPVFSPARSILFGFKNVFYFLSPFVGFKPSYNVSLTFWTGFGTLDAIAPVFISKISIYICSIFTFLAFFIPLLKTDFKAFFMRFLFLLLIIFILFSQAYAAIMTQNFMQGRYLISMYLLFFSLVVCGMQSLSEFMSSRGFQKSNINKFLSALFIAYMFIQLFCYVFVIQRYFYV